MAGSKLVRDRIPHIILQNGEKPVVRKLRGKALRTALAEKLTEETQEAVRAIADKKSVNAVLEEFADILEVIDALLVQYKSSRQDLRVIQGRKRMERGGFKHRILLVEVRK